MNTLDLLEKDWQLSYFDNIAKIAKADKVTFNEALEKDISMLKKRLVHLPDYLYRYYRPTFASFIDIKKDLLFLSNPENFNDPFEGKIGLNDNKYIKKKILSYIRSKKLFEKYNIEVKFNNLEEFINNEKHYSDFTDIVGTNEDMDFYLEVDKQIELLEKAFINKANIIRQNQFRICSFSAFDSIEFLKKIAMWAHYTDNHKGFCVRYNLKNIKKQCYNNLNRKQSDIYKQVQLNLFPVIYTNKRIGININILDKIDDKNKEVLYNLVDFNKLNYKASLIKSVDWQYENEYRLLLRNSDLKENNKLKFPFIDHIYLGCRMDLDLKEEFVLTIKEYNKKNEDNLTVTALCMHENKLELKEKLCYVYKNYFREIPLS